MKHTSFKQFCENKDATLIFRPTPNSSYVDVAHNRTFEEAIDPAIKNFISQMKSIINEFSPKLNKIQIDHILKQIKIGLLSLEYSPHEDLGKAIQRLWSAENSRRPTKKSIETVK